MNDDDDYGYEIEDETSYSTELDMDAAILAKQHS